MKKILLPLLITLIAYTSYGQLFHNDPYKIDNFLYFNLEHSRQNILNNKIHLIEKYSYNQNPNGKRKGRPKLLYTISFNQNGDPIEFHQTYIKEVWWLYKLKPPHYYYDYYFSYDSLNRLVSIKETIRESDYAHDENEAFYTYNSIGNVSQILYSRKHIYKKGFTHRGVTYPDDTLLTETSLVYNDRSTVSALLGKSYASNEQLTRYDTSIVNTTFDSLFISKTTPPGVKKDSAGNVVEVLSFKRLGKGIGGDCLYSKTEVDFTINYFYDSTGVVIKRELYNQNHTLIQTTVFKYDKTGLITSILATDITRNIEKKKVVIYRYNHAKNYLEPTITE